MISSVSNFFSDAFSKGDYTKYVFGHSRLVTNGSQLDDTNNQPIIKDGIVSVHNGIITNVDDLWKENQKLSRSYDIDTDIDGNSMDKIHGVRVNDTIIVATTAAVLKCLVVA